ncbi:MAG: TIGR00300 family protein [Actinobacteria bacterium]|nr:TIGR00300 family protein [Actinomycetota bacterium]MCB9412265.1 TIGR00300 family protein [Actinomycetota bacterium]
MITEKIELRGHVIDTGQLGRVLDEVLEGGGDYLVERFVLGRSKDDESYARIEVKADDTATLREIMSRITQEGVTAVDPKDATIEPSPSDGVFPEGFYASTNLETHVRIAGEWVPVSNPEMDCALVVEGTTVCTVPMCDVRAGELVVVGSSGVKVTAPAATPLADESVFEFMNSVVSSEKPQALLVRQIAEEMRQTKAAGKKILWVGGPAVVHTGGAGPMSDLVRAGYCDVLFAGNALATHDIEAAMYGTSLGVDLSKGSGVEHGHEHHLRAINRIRSYGSIPNAVAAGALTSGIMHALVEQGCPFVLVGSVRDDGPLPDVYTDVIAGQRAMRGAIADVGFTIMVATMLHAIGTGNLLPANIPLVCVDINPATVTKLADRGSSHATGVVTDIGLFLEQLADELVPGRNRG